MQPQLVLGLDACEWKVVQHLVREGRLPESRRLLAEHTHGRLDSILDTARAILSLAGVKRRSALVGVPLPLRGEAVPA
ncbi:MAG: hypothetical protein U1F36_05430 [Planctomycetota bacterium]